MSSLSHRIKHELLEFLFPAVFFFASFQLLALTREMALREYGIRVSVRKIMKGRYRITRVD